MTVLSPRSSTYDRRRSGSKEARVGALAFAAAIARFTMAVISSVAAVTRVRTFRLAEGRCL